MSQRFVSLYRGLTRTVHFLEDGFLALTLTAMILLAASQIVLRNFGGGFVWSDELLRVMVLWLGLLGAVAASREPKHINVDLVSRILPDRFSSVVKVATHTFTGVVSTVVAWYAMDFVLLEREFGSLALVNFPAWILQLILPVGFGLIGLRFFGHALRETRNAMMGIPLPEPKSTSTTGEDA